MVISAGRHPLGAEVAQHDHVDRGLVSSIDRGGRGPAGLGLLRDDGLHLHHRPVRAVEAGEEVERADLRVGAAVLVVHGDDLYWPVLVKRPGLVARRISSAAAEAWP